MSRLRGLLSLVIVAIYWATPVYARLLSDADVEQSRARRDAASTAVYAGVQQQALSAAVLAALRSIDPGDVQAEAAPGKMERTGPSFVCRALATPNNPPPSAPVAVKRIERPPSASQPLSRGDVTP